MAAYLLIRGGEGGQNLGKSAYIILERSLTMLKEGFHSEMKICNKQVFCAPVMNMI